VLRKIYNLYLSGNRGFARQLRDILGFTPRFIHFYERAFTHKSMGSNQNNDSDNKDDRRYTFNNERLEYLGDAILDSVTAEYLFKKYPTQDEGFLTQMRSKMVNRKTLNQVSAEMGLDVFLHERGVRRVSKTMMGNTFEAFIGAVYLDVGYRRTKRFIIQKMLKQYIDVHELETTNHNYKSRLLEHCQKKHQTVSYEVIKHYRTKSNRERFKIAVLVDDQQMATAEDFNKKSAEQTASRHAMQKLGLLNKEEVASE
jgi:ribonuclease-3